MSLCECGCGETTKIASRTKSKQGHVKGQPLRFVNGHNTRLRVGERHPQWKGAEASYMAIHNWLRRSKAKTGVCGDCGAQGKTDWSNISREYRRDLSDYRELCRGCHVALDRVRGVDGRFTSDTYGSPTIGVQLAKELAT